MKRLFKALAAGLTGLLMSAAAHASLSVTLVPSTITVAQDTVFTIKVHLSGLDTTQSVVSGFDFRLFFDDNLLQATDALLNASVFTPGFLAIDYLNPGEIGANYVDASLDFATLAGLQSGGDFDLLTLEFKSRSVNGGTFLSFGPSLAFDRNLIDFDGFTLAADYGQACIIVGEGGCDQRVPEPASMALATLGLIAAWLPSALRRRRMRL